MVICSQEQLYKYIVKYKLDNVIDEKVVQLLRLIKYEKDEYITVPGGECNGMGIVMSGKIDVIPSSEAGREMLLTCLQPMDLIGEIEYFFKSDYIYTTRAMEEVLILNFPIQVIDTYLINDVKFLQLVCKSFACKTLDHSSSFSQALLYNMKSRLCNYILQRSLKLNTNTIPYSGQEASKALGITDRHLRRLIADYVEQGTLLKSRTHIKILDKKRLRKDAYEI